MQIGDFSWLSLVSVRTLRLRRDRYSAISGAYNAIANWAERLGYHISGPGREIYVTDPASGIPPADYVTEVQMPVEKNE